MKPNLAATVFAVVALGIAASINAADSDTDGVDDSIDNCVKVENASQTDTDKDGFGNQCDPDFNNDNRVDFSDLAHLKAKFFGTDPLTDLNADGRTDFADLAIMKSMFFGPPGPGADAGRIVGSVAGTSIVALDSNGVIVAIADTAGREFDVDRNDDGFLDAFSFTLPAIPLHEAVRVFLVRNGVIRPMYFDSTGDDFPDTNVLVFNTVTNLELGYLDESIVHRPGVVIPEHSPVLTAFVTAGAEDKVIPSGIGIPSTDGLTLEELNASGLNALSDGWYLAAKTYFETANNVAGNEQSTQADTARFFHAITRVIAIGFSTFSDGDSTDMNQLGDFLDLFGVADDMSRGNWRIIEDTTTMPSDSPTGNTLRDSAYSIVSAELRAAVTTLDQVSTGFNKNWKEPEVRNLNGEPVESDYGDALFFKSLFKTMLASLAIQRAYELDADIDATFNRNRDDDPLNDVTVQEFLADSTNDQIMSLVDAGKLAEAKLLLLDALADMDAAVDAIDAETDHQQDDFITLMTLTNEDAATAKDFIADARKSIQGLDSVFDQNDANADNDWRVHLDIFFDTGLDFRTPDRLPAFTGNNVSGLFPDPTFNSIVIMPDLNEDIRPADGIPDLFQKKP